MNRRIRASAHELCIMNIRDIDCVLGSNKRSLAMASMKENESSFIFATIFVLFA